MATKSHELALCIINDDGFTQGNPNPPMYGTSYQKRLEIARGTLSHQLSQWTQISLIAALAYSKEFGTSEDNYAAIFSVTDLLFCAAQLAEYYADHIKEVDAA